MRSTFFAGSLKPGGFRGIIDGIDKGLNGCFGTLHFNISGEDAGSETEKAALRIDLA